MDNDKAEISPYLVSSESNDGNKPNYFTTELIFVSIFIIISIIVIIYYFSSSSSSFLNPGYRSDKQMDDSYLEDQIEFLNKMQERNMSKM